MHLPFWSRPDTSWTKGNTCLNGFCNALKKKEKKKVLTLKLLIAKRDYVDYEIFLDIPQNGAFNLKSNPGRQEAEGL